MSQMRRMRSKMLLNQWNWPTKMMLIFLRPISLLLVSTFSIQSRDNTDNKGVEEAMPNIRAGLRRAEDFMKAQKTKNLSNKNKECTSIARAIVKLVERQDLGGMAASMLMMLMRQLKAMNSSMDRREQQERKQGRWERKKRKLCKKHRAMKKAKKKSKKR